MDNEVNKLVAYSRRLVQVSKKDGPELKNLCLYTHDGGRTKEEETNQLTEERKTKI